ncbi:uncharacterized protein EV420DRAFT_1480805 [Desarmillaria tabescens]|uniref:Uncharacterized protein n=1 Tax=Armillaria tabescens TaxID=1929756 RepID=A0AA39KEI0_ARMTA|nr:uncharacterized protein EV420DRAFT_1480805 [Desarmillaria tabescens]KAK0457333.1 hypothetical protein EV420DRAFT_1480805 [Desarmillaria tabescens]
MPAVLPLMIRSLSVLPFPLFPPLAVLVAWSSSLRVEFLCPVRESAAMRREHTIQVQNNALQKDVESALGSYFRKEKQMVPSALLDIRPSRRTNEHAKQSQEGLLWIPKNGTSRCLIRAYPSMTIFYRALEHACSTIKSPGVTGLRCAAPLPLNSLGRASLTLIHAITRKNTDPPEAGSSMMNAGNIDLSHGQPYAAGSNLRSIKGCHSFNGVGKSEACSTNDFSNAVLKGGEMWGSHLSEITPNIQINVASGHIPVQWNHFQGSR